MECPACRKPIDTATPGCPSCGYPFPKRVQDDLVLYFELKQELDDLAGGIRTDLWSKLMNLWQTVARYRERISEELAGLSSPSEPLSPETELTETPPVSTTLDDGESPAPAPRVSESVPSPLETVFRLPAAKTVGMEVQLGQKWLLVAGLVTMVFGIGYFLKYSFEQGWIGPAGRVSMAYLWGMAFLAGGNRYRKKYGTFGLSLMGGGIATCYFATFAGFQIYHLLPQFPAFLLMVLITVLACLLAVLHDTKWLAVLGLVGGFLTPFMLSTGQDNLVVLMSYLTILNLGILSIAIYRKWDLLNTLGFLLTYLVYGAWFSRHYTDAKFWPAILFLNGFFCIYSAVPFAYHLLGQRRGSLRSFFILMPNGFVAFAFSFVMIRAYASLEWVSITTLFYAMVFLTMASYLYRNDRHDEDAFPILLAQSAVFVAMTVPILFSGHWITVFWALQGAGLFWMGLRLDRKSLLVAAWVVLAIAVGKYLVYDYSEVFRFDFSTGALRGTYTTLLPERIATAAVVLAVLFAGARLARRSGPRLLGALRLFPSDAAVFSGSFGVICFLVLNMETSAFFHSYLLPARFAALSVLWTIFSAILMAVGFRKNAPVLRKTAIVLFGATVLKVFLVDMSNISTPYRIVSFFILGVMLVATSFLYYRFKDRLHSQGEDTDRETGRQG